MTSAVPTDFIALAIDGGTSNLRVRLLRGHSVLAEVRGRVGAADVAQGSAAERLADALRLAIRDILVDPDLPRPEAVVACGMITSEVGLCAVPHVPAPAGLDELARGAVVLDRPDLVEGPILFVPGVRTPPSHGVDGWAGADVMRGEECEVLGLTELHQGDAPVPTPDPGAGERLYILPGSHSKLVRLSRDSRIVGSYTTLAGELRAAVARHTILAASLPESSVQEPDPEAVSAGMRLARQEGLGRAAFLVRLAALQLDVSPEWRAAFWTGAVVGIDVDHLIASGFVQRAAPTVRFHVGGTGVLRRLYVEALRDAVGPERTVDEGEAAEYAPAVGASLVAWRRRQLDTA